MKELQEFCLDSDIQFSQETIYRFAAFHKFDLDRTKEALLENRANNHLNLELKGRLRRQVAAKMIFPLSGLHTRKADMEVCFIEARRIDPDASQGSATRVIENLCYVLNDLSRTKEQCARGVAVIINIKDVDRSKFTLNFWMQLMMVLQGQLVPTTVNLVLVVGSPKGFQNNLWKTQAKSMLPVSFAKKILSIDQDHLLNSGYFVEGCETFLPTSVGGWKLGGEIVEDYLDLKEFERRQKAATTNS